MSDPTNPNPFPAPAGWYFAPGTPSVSGVVCFSVKLPDHQAFKAAFNELTGILANPDAWWTNPDGMTAEEAAELYASVFMKAQALKETCMVGQAVVWPGDLALIPENTMECAGQPLSSEDYPELFTILGYRWGGTGGTFNLPDWRHKAVIGVGPAGGGFTAHPVGWTGGAETVVLTTQQMASHHHNVPAHTHTTQSHNHIQEPHHHAYDPVVIPDLDLEDLGLPQGNAAQIVPLVTENTYDETAVNQAATVTVDNKAAFDTANTGSSQAHPNMQPSAAAYWIIYVR